MQGPLLKPLIHALALQGFMPTAGTTGRYPWLTRRAPRVSGARVSALLLDAAVGLVDLHGAALNGACKDSCSGG